MKPFLSKIYHLENPIQNYDWGSRTELSRLFNITNIENNPQAELWIGAHHRAPSLVKINENEKMPLDTMIDKYPDLILGKKIAKQYNNNLPFLFKIFTVSQTACPKACLYSISEIVTPEAPPQAGKKITTKKIKMSFFIFWLCLLRSSPDLE